MLYLIRARPFLCPPSSAFPSSTRCGIIYRSSSNILFTNRRNPFSALFAVGETANRIALASLSAAVAETATFPIDIVKTRLRLRLRGESGHRPSPPNSIIREVASEMWSEARVLPGPAPCDPSPFVLHCYEDCRVRAPPVGRRGSGDRKGGLGRSISGCG